MKRHFGRLGGILAVLILVVAFTTIAYGAVSTYSKYTGNTYTHSDELKNYLIVDGIDVSGFQGDINWSKVKADGIDFAIIRAAGRGYGSEGKLYNDDTFAKNIKGAKSNGIMVGVYFFSQAKTKAEARGEVNRTISLLNSAGFTAEDLDLPLFMDYESAGGSDGRIYGMTKTERTNIADYWMDYALSKGFTSGIYTDLNFGKVKVNGQVLSESHNYWAAQYYTQNQFAYDYCWWQYASSGKVSGISGSVDMNFWYINPNNRSTLNLSEQASLRELSGFQEAGPEEENVLASIADCEVAINGTDTFTYSSGKWYEPKIIVKNGETVLTEGTDYKVSYIMNSKVGTAYAIAVGRGSYVDYKLVPFTIKKAAATTTATNSNDKIIKGVKAMTISLKSQKLSTGIKLTWSRKTTYKLDCIQIYRSTKKTSAYKRIYTTKTGSAKTYLNKKSALKKGIRYYYKVRGVRTINGKKYYTKWSNLAYRKW